MHRIIYNGSDITQRVKVTGYVHEMYAEGQCDRLYISFADDTGMWDAWHPAPGDVISAEVGAAQTGDMFIASIEPRDGYLSLQALAAPTSAFISKNRAWEGVMLHHIISGIAGGLDLKCEIHGIANAQIKYLAQDDESDLAFLSRVLESAGAACLVYNRSLVCYYKPYIESMPSGYTLTVTSGMDFAYTNDCGGYVRREFMGGVAPGSILRLKNDRGKSWDCRVFVTRVRHEEIGRSTKIFFRRLGDG
jgi:phage protein D